MHCSSCLQAACVATDASALEGSGAAEAKLSGALRVQNMRAVRRGQAAAWGGLKFGLMASGATRASLPPAPRPAGIVRVARFLWQQLTASRSTLQKRIMVSLQKVVVLGNLCTRFRQPPPTAALSSRHSHTCLMQAPCRSKVRALPHEWLCILCF